MICSLKASNEFVSLLSADSVSNTYTKMCSKFKIVNIRSYVSTGKGMAPCFLEPRIVHGMIYS